MSSGKLIASRQLIRRDMNRRDFLRLGALTGGGALAALGGFAGCSDPALTRTFAGALGLASASGGGCGPGGEPMPTSPFILNPFAEALPIPSPLAPVNPASWDSLGPLPDPRTGGLQDSDGQTHQIGPSALGLPTPIIYQIKLQVAPYEFTSSLVQPIDAGGNPVIPPDGIPGPRSLPASTIYGFNGTFPGPMINAEYGKPCLLRFENHLDIDNGLDRGDFGSPEWSFLTHLHNGHTAPESDGNPFHKEHGYHPGMWVDNLYLNWPAGGDNAEKQSFFWFHDHQHNHTGADVYKGMVGLYPIYDPLIDFGDETSKRGLRLPGRRTDNPDGSFSVKYDIPLAFYDCRMDDGVTPHQDFHIPIDQCGATHPEQWGKTFFRHYPNHGFVGDVFTVNGHAFPFLEVERRKYRFRFLDASIARCYEFMLMTGTPQAAPGTQGQWQLPDGEQCMRFTQIASEGGLLPKPIVRDSFQIWPAKRREVVVDFTKYMDGSPTQPGDEIYLVNTLEMPNGRKPEFNAPGATLGYKVPVMKIIIGGNPPQPDLSIIPNKLRALPTIPNLKGLTQRTFVLERSGTFGGEIEWLINGEQFDPLRSLANPIKGRPELWTITNGGGGWVHPFHLHMEEHQVLQRVGSTNTHPDDKSKEDVVALDPGESVTIYRNFRTFTGKYVCHCHNLAHEDHAMMFGWTIVP